MYHRIMLRQRILADCFKNVNNLIVRRKSVVIRQIDTTKLTKAQQIKKLNYETSYLFGSKVKKPKEAIAVEKHDENDSKGINSEIYWTLESSKKGRIEDKEVSHVEEKAKKRVKKITSTKKKTNKIEEKLPETFAKFKLDLPKPVKVTIQDALNNIDSQISSNLDGKIAEQKEIPFDQKLLRNIVNFPLIIDKNDLIFDIFDKSTAKNNYLGFTPSVSKILQGTMSASQKQALLQWKNLKIAELGLQGFEEMQKMYLSRGKKFHECLQKYFSNVEMDEDDISMDVIEVWKSISHVIKEFEMPATLTEHNIHHPYLCYKGIVDCVAIHQKSNTLCVIEWKNSDRYKKSVGDTYDAPLQLCAYLSALNATEFQNSPLSNGVIVVAYNDGQDADLFKLSSNDLKKYYKVWLNRLQDYWIRYRDNTLNLDEI